MIKKVILVFKTHFDIGFTDTAEQIIKTYKGKMIEDVLDTCEASKDLGDCKYVWTMPSWPLYTMLDMDRKEKSQNARRAAELVKRGQLKWHALAFTSHFDFCGVEDYIRGYQISKEISKEFQLPNAVTAKMTDVPGHGIMLPSLLHMMGVEFLHLGSNEFATPPDVPLLFNWESPDGSQVLTMYSKAAYGTSLEAPKDWKYPVWMALLHTHDNSGPQSKEILETLIHKAKKMYPDAEIVTGTMDDFYEELRQYELDVPTLSMDLADTWIHGVGTYPDEVSRVREARRILTRVEKALNMLKMDQGQREQIQTKMNDAYFELLMFGEHTWGLDVKTHMGENRAYEKEEFLEFKNSSIAKLMEFSWDEQRARAQNALQYAEDAKQILSGAMIQDEKKVLIFNPSGKKESMYVDLDHLKEKLMGKMLYSKNGKLQLEEVGGRLMVYVTNMEPFEFTQFSIEDACEKDLDHNSNLSELPLNSIENHRYRVVCDLSNGNLVEIYDKKIGENLINPPEELGKSEGPKESFLGYRYDKYGFDDINEFLRTYGYKFSDWGINDNGKKDYPVCDHMTYRPQMSSVQVSENCIRIEKVTSESSVEYGDAEKIITEINLPKHGEEIYVTVSLQNKQESLYGESGYICMPFSMKNPQIQINKTGCLIDIKKDIVKDGGHVNYCIENSVVLSDETWGITVVSYDIPLLSVGEIGMFQFKSEYEEHGGTLLFNTYNNMWGTNFPQWIGGDFKYRFTITSHLKEEIQQEYDQSLVRTENALAMIGSLEEDGMEFPHFFTLPDYLRPSALEKQEDTYILRVRNTSGDTHLVELSIPDEIAELQLVQLTGEVICASKKEESRVLTFEARAYGVYNIAWQVDRGTNPIN